MIKNRFIRIFVFLVGVFLIIKLSSSIFDLWKKGSLLDQEEERFAKARLENEELKQEYEKIQSPEYIEKQAREKLGLAKEGEVVVILPPELTSSDSGDEINNHIRINKPVWKQWIGFLFD